MTNDLRRFTLFHAYSLTNWAIVAVSFFYFDQISRETKFAFLGILVPALLTVATLLFSAILMALQMGSAQFSPRIARGFFVEDRENQFYFFTFLLGITGCSAVFLSGTDSHLLLDAAIGAGFLMVSVIFPRFVFRIISSVNVASISRKICERTLAEIDTWHGKLDEKAAVLPVFETKKPDLSQNQLVVRAEDFGFLASVDFEKLAHLAKKTPGLEVFVEPIVGSFISKNEPLAVVSGLDLSGNSHLAAAVHRNFEISEYRSFRQDAQFGIRQLVDIAIKAISPAVNDPTTAVNCIHYLGEIARRLAAARWPSAKRADFVARGVHFSEPSFENALDHAFDQIFQWGKKDHVIVRQLFRALAGAAEVAADRANLQTLAAEAEAMRLDAPFDSREFEESARRAHLFFLQKAAERAAQLEPDSAFSAHFLAVFEEKRADFEKEKTRREAGELPF